MSIQVFRCEEHGEFEVLQDVKELVPPTIICIHNLNTTGHGYRCCGRISPWVPQVIAFSVNGGTGAQRSSQ